MRWARCRALNARVVKHATLELRVKRGAVDRRFASAERLATFLGGFVQSSDRSGDVATVTMRIPSGRFGATRSGGWVSWGRSRRSPSEATM